MFGVLNSSKDLSSIFKVLYSLGKLAVVNPIHAEIFDKYLAGNLEQSFKGLNFLAIAFFDKQDFSKTLNAVDLGLLGAEHLSKVFQAQNLAFAFSQQIKVCQRRKSKADHGLAVVFHDIISL